jgi:hypothetical protein
MARKSSYQRERNDIINRKNPLWGEAAVMLTFSYATNPSFAANG